MKWPLIEDNLSFPSDYVDFINTYGSGRIAEFIVIFNPFCTLNKHILNSLNHLFILIKLLAQFLYFESRALSLDTLNKLYKVYEVLAPIHADARSAIPWVNQPGK
ncbi:glycohydrolase toxin TNT-related protein [Phytobacter diazotrophicus]|nr:hypothetical protein MRY16398_33590 [Phytobacter sp. MRY16-398]